MMKELDRERPMRAIHRKTGEVGTVAKIDQSKMLLIDGSNPEGWQGYFDRYGNPKDDFCPWRVENVHTVNWDKPIEAVHDSGHVSGATLERGHGTLRQIGYLDLTASHQSRWFAEDGSGSDSGWRIRNTQTYTEAVMELGGANSVGKSYAEPDADGMHDLREAKHQDAVIWDRMTKLIREIAASDECWWRLNRINQSAQEEARAIAELLPPVVDPDLAEAREVAASMYDNGRNELLASNVRAGLRDDGMDVSIALASIKRGRALERGE